jgi:hypothetical protein
MYTALMRERLHYSCGVQKLLRSYIFHEVRSPLNNLHLGMELLASTPELANNPETLSTVCSDFMNLQ